MPPAIHTESQRHYGSIRRSSNPTKNSASSRIREDILMLHRFGFHLDTISEMMHLSRGDVLAVCPESAERRLSQRATNILAYGRYADCGGKSKRTRMRNLGAIAVAYTADELRREKGVGPVVFAEIEQWLEGQGLALR